MQWSQFAVLAMPLLAILGMATAHAAPREVRFSQSDSSVETYDFVEVTVSVTGPDVANPFTEASVAGELQAEGGNALRVDGFCDSADGTLFRIRFMPTRAGPHTYRVVYREGAFEVAHSSRFDAVDGERPGVVRVDPDHPSHFLWEGTGEHYFYNGTTTYFLAGWDEESIRRNLDRLAALKVNRVRAAVSGRVQNARVWFENVFPTEEFTFLLNPWVAARPDSVADPGFDVTRFNVAYWRKWDVLVRHARERGIVVSVIFYVDGRRPGVDPFGKAGMGGADEQRYYRYAVARLGAFANVMWDISNEYRHFRDDAWAEKMGGFVAQVDAYDHLTSVHGFGDFRFMRSPWADFAMYQAWDEGGGYDFMLARRRDQQATGRTIPQVNEEYGYEDHYPVGWGGNRKAPARSADNRRRLAWAMVMAGGYQTAGERADTGTGWGPDTGGGWVNGRGDESMVLFRGYGHMVDFFTSFDWWRTAPDSDSFSAQREGVLRTALTHLVYTRSADGEAALYVDGELASTGPVPGGVDGWDSDFRLALANELTRDRPWLGELQRVALYDRALSDKDIQNCYEAGPSGEVTQPLALYVFREGAGNWIRDVSGSAEPVDLQIADLAAVEWLAGGGLAVNRPALIASAGPAVGVTEAIRRSGALTVEAWVSPANTDQSGPARIVTLSRDPGQRNFTLGQDRQALVMRLRTTATSPNGEPPLWAPAGGTTPAAMALRSPEGDLAAVYLPAGGEVTIKPNALREGLRARWFNPRTGEWGDTQPGARAEYRAPDRDDWALLFER